MAQEPLTYDEWVRRAASEEVPPPADGVLHFGERAALVEQLSYLKRRNAKLSRQQRAVLLAACEAQAAHARCADFAGELLSKSGDDEDLGRLAQENAELKRKTAALADYVRRTAPAEEGHVDSDTTSSDSDNDDDDDVLPPPPNDDVRPSCLGDDDRRRCEWSAFVAGVVGAFGDSWVGMGLGELQATVARVGLLVQPKGITLWGSTACGKPAQEPCAQLETCSACVERPWCSWCSTTQSCHGGGKHKASGDLCREWHELACPKLPLELVYEQPAFARALMPCHATDSDPKAHPWDLALLETGGADC